jgi:hypothetical protein
MRCETLKTASAMADDPAVADTATTVDPAASGTGMAAGAGHCFSDECSSHIAIVLLKLVEITPLGAH